MALELSLRSVIALLLLSATVISGCDRQSQPPQQANETAGSETPANAAAPAAAPAIDRSHKGEAAPDLSFLDPKGTKVTLATFKGKPVLLNLWATWCAPCVKEMPTLDAVAAARGDSLKVLALSQDLEGKAKVDPFFAQAKFKALEPYLDPESNFSLGLGLNLPTTILYDKDSREVWRVTGGMEWDGEQAAALIAEAG